MKARGLHRWNIDNECMACGLRRIFRKGNAAKWSRVYYTDSRGAILGQSVPFRCVMMPDDQYTALIEWRAWRPTRRERDDVTAAVTAAAQPGE